MNSLPITAHLRLCQFAVVAVCALAAGCRNDPYLDSHIEILNAEKRALEDQIYELEYDYERKVAELEEAKERLSRIENDEARPRRSNQTPRTDTPQTDTPRVEMPDDDSLDLSPPTVTPGVPDHSSNILPAPSSGNRSSQHNANTHPVRTGPALLEPEDPRITHIHIDPEHTGGSDFDQQPGDDGILVVIEPRNRNDAFVPLAGSLTVVALDYAKRDAGNEARIAKWELTAQQVDRSLHNNSTQRGIYLQLPWGETRPESSRLMLAVRYTTADGRKLEATRDIFVAIPGQFSQRWTPRSSTAPDNAEQQNGLNVARQPSATDGANLVPTSPRSDTAARPVVTVSHEADTPQPASPTTTPTWHPYR